MDFPDAGLAAEIDDAIRDHVRIPPNRLSLGDRIRVLVEGYRDTTESVESLGSEVTRREQQIGELEEQLAEARNQGGVLRS